jgi:hypothetical protein
MKKSSRFTGLVVMLLGAMKLLNDLGKPRVEALHGFDVLGLVASGGLLGIGFVGLMGRLKFRQLPEGPKQAATERVGCVEGRSVITFRPHREFRISTVWIRSSGANCLHPVSEWVSFEKSRRRCKNGSSEEIVGAFRLGQLAK